MTTQLFCNSVNKGHKYDYTTFFNCTSAMVLNVSVTPPPQKNTHIFHNKDNTTSKNQHALLQIQGDVNTCSYSHSTGGKGGGQEDSHRPSWSFIAASQALATFLHSQSMQTWRQDRQNTHPLIRSSILICRSLIMSYSICPRSFLVLPAFSTSFSSMVITSTEWSRWLISEMLSLASCKEKEQAEINSKWGTSCKSS